MYRPAALATGIFLIIAAAMQVLRAINKVEVLAAGIEIPVWASWIAAPALALLGYWLLKERSGKD